MYLTKKRPAVKRKKPAAGAKKRTYKRPQERSHLEIALLDDIKTAGLPIPEEEYKFFPTRKWKFDFAYPDLMIAIEVEGGIWGGRHTSGIGFQNDCEKYDVAALMGWKLLRFPPNMISSGVAIQFISLALQGDSADIVAALSGEINV